MFPPATNFEIHPKGVANVLRPSLGFRLRLLTLRIKETHCGADMLAYIRSHHRAHSQFMSRELTCQPTDIECGDSCGNRISSLLQGGKGLCNETRNDAG